MQNLKTILLFLILTSSFFVNAEERCFTYSESESPVLGIEMSAVTEGGLYSKLLRVFSDFITDAKENDTESISKKYTPFDGSKDFLLNELKKTPDKFTSYAGLKNFKFVGDIFSWGNYKFVYVDYQHQNGKLKIAESFFCTNDCLISNIFEQSSRDSTIDLISRLMYEKNRGNLKAVTCPGTSIHNLNKLSLYPEYKFEEIFPVNIYFSNIAKDFESKGVETLEKILMSKNELCYKSLKSGVVFELDGAVNNDIVNSILKACTVNTKNNSLTPINFIVDDKVEKRYLTVASYVSRLLSIVECKWLLSVNDSKGRSLIVTKVDFSTGEKAIMVLPISTSSSGVRFDWESFGDNLGELLSNEKVAKFLDDFTSKDTVTERAALQEQL